MSTHANTSQFSNDQGNYHKGQDLKKKKDNAKHEDWYVKDYVVKDDAREVFETYSGIPADQVDSHVGRVRDRAFENMPYACIGSCRFLEFSLSRHPAYLVLRILMFSRSMFRSRVKLFLHLGCCIGHDLRKLAYDGIPSERLYGIETDPAFIELGYDLFLDRDKLQGQILPVDLFREPSPDLVQQLRGGVDMVYVASFFSIFTWDHQVILCTNLTRIMIDKRGGMILGGQLGCKEPGEYPHLKKDGTTSYWHDPQSWQKLWDEVGKKTGTRWEVDATLDKEDFGDYEKNRWGIPTQRRLLFTIYRLK